MTLTGPNTLYSGNSVRNASYRIFDENRVVAKMRAPNTGPATVVRNPMGQVQISVARAHEKIDLDFEELGNLSKMVGPNSVIDTAGQDYIERQEMALARHFGNFVEMMAAGMARDSLYYTINGDNWFPNFTGGGTAQQISFKIPAGNKNQLNMLGSGNILTAGWQYPDANIPADILSIQAAFVQLTGMSMLNIIVNSVTWASIIQNNHVREIGGTANTVYAEYKWEPATFPDGQPGTYQYAILRGIPLVKWFICDDVLAVNTDIDPVYTSVAPATGSLAKIVPDGMAIMMAEPAKDWVQLYHGGEYVIENEGQPAVFRGGYYAWKQWTTQPASVSLIGVLNAVPLLYRPLAIAPATVFFG